MRKFLLFVFFFSLTVFGYSNNNRIDSLQQELLQANQDTTKIYLLGQLSLAYDKTDRFKAFDYAKQALVIAEKINDKNKIGEHLNWLGDLYWYSGDYPKASDYYFKALAIYEKLNNQKEIANCYRNIGWIYQGQNDYKRTLEYYNKALKINESLGMKRRIMFNYDDLGIVYKLMQDYPPALEYAYKTIALSKELKLDKSLGSSYGNLAFIYYEMKNYDKAIEYFETSIGIEKKNKDYYNLAEGLTGIAKCYLAQKKIDKALSCLQEALSISEKYKYEFIRIAVYERLAEAYHLKKEYEAAYNYLNLYKLYNDSTYTESNNSQINEMSAKYEFDKKELQISSLEQEKQQEKKFRIFLIVFCCLIVCFAFFLYRGNIQKKKTNNQLSIAYKQIEEKNKDITDSINYSKRIQEATLPPLNKLHNLFNDAFILYKPKDIVSGDFYWFVEKNDKKIIAACDCTGHGVPGALMSMIGNNFLNQIVNIKGITSPDEILNQLNTELFKSLNQNEKVQTKDGMDISLVVFNNENEIEFAGAQRPLWIVTMDEILNTQVVKEVKGTKHSIGGIQSQNSSFSKTKLTLAKGDSIYMFTDGYVDQFGGEQGKKFMAKNFKKTLLEIHSKSANEQEQLLDKQLLLWMGNSEQVDDILVIGIKI
jgi:serine phosphatase RsbU (regulator of sigma subunit)/Tfp pilus assembly protein PilF